MRAKKIPDDRKPYIPFGTAAAVLGISEMRLRNWLLRNQVHLDADALRSNTRKHRRFSYLDMVRLYIISWLSSLGLEISRMADLLEYIFVHQMWEAKISKQIPAVETKRPLNIHQPVVPFLRNKTLTIVVHQKQYAETDREAAHMIGFIREKGAGPVPSHLLPPMMHLSIDIEMMIRTIEGRLRPEELERIRNRRRYRI